MSRSARTTRHLKLPSLPAGMLLFLAAAGAAPAASVRLEVSSLETQVGVPVRVSIIIENADRHEAPVLPEIPDATVRSAGPPSQSSQFTLSNGVSTRSVTLTYVYQLTPQREGRITIPAVSVEADGRRHQTQPVDIAVTRSETGDLLFVEVAGNRPSVYFGEPVELTLRIWLKPYESRQHRMTFNEEQMLHRLEWNQSQWGVFQEPLQQMLSQRRRPVGRSVLRKDASGIDRSYYLYELQRTLWPNRPGPLDAGEIRILVNYPVRIGPATSLFSIGSLAILDEKPVAAPAGGEPVMVRPLPEQGRPLYFRGAVGQYTIKAEARPTEAAVGDPITLTLTVSGNGHLATLQPPPLPEIEELKDSFQIPSDPLAGIVTGNHKQFTESIRARSDAVSVIPPIPFAYFDPVQEQYVTVRTQPIPLSIRPSDKLPLSHIVEAPGAKAGDVQQLTAVVGGILANYSSPDEVLSQQVVRPGLGSALAVGVPPLIFLAGWIRHRRSERLRQDAGYARRRTAGRSALRRLSAAAALDPPQLAAAVAEALAGYTADRCNLPPGALTRAEVVEHLIQRGVAAETVVLLDALLERCEHLQYGGGGETNGEDLIQPARGIIGQLERWRYSFRMPSSPEGAGDVSPGGKP